MSILSQDLTNNTMTSQKQKTSSITPLAPANHGGLVNGSKSGGSRDTLTETRLKRLTAYLRTHPAPENMAMIRTQVYRNNIRHPDPHPELQFNFDYEDIKRQINPHPERLTAEGVVVVHPSGMQVQAVSKFAVQNPQGGGTIGRKVTGRSKRARGRLMRHLIQVDLNDVSAERKGAKYSQCLFLTLTYPDVFQDHERGKEHIKALRKRIGYHYGLKWAIWVQEWQKRGALHYHIVLLLPKVVKVAGFRKWLAQSWYEVVGSENPKHLRAGTGADAIYVANNEPGNLLSYLSKELGGFGGKRYQLLAVNEETGEILETGKTWGIWGRNEFKAMKVAVCKLRIVGQEAWQRFKENVALRFAPSAYLSKIADMAWWGGGLLYGEGKGLLENLLEGIPAGAWEFVNHGSANV